MVVAGAGGRKHSVVARIAAKQEFAGYWEYVLDEAIFTAPAHPFWGGTAMIGRPAICSASARCRCSRCARAARPSRST